jgi:alkylhydroperoxidase/carboxymuconolactone decarboxylase family protein YurZ
MTPDDRDALLERIRSDRGAFPANFEVAIRHDAERLRVFHDEYMLATAESTLDEKTQQLIIIAMDAAIYYHYGLKFHMVEALKLGLTEADIASALRLSGLAAGFHAPLMAYQLLDEAIAEFRGETAVDGGDD